MSVRDEGCVLVNVKLDNALFGIAFKTVAVVACITHPTWYILTSFLTSCVARLVPFIRHTHFVFYHLKHIIIPTTTP